VQYIPRSAFIPFHSRSQRWGLLVCHRRAGKTVAAINDVVGRALHTRKTNAQYAYMAPFFSQAKRVAFDYLLRYTTDIRTNVNIAELTVTLVNGAKIFLFGADNPDALRGIYLDGVVMDEPAAMHARVFTEVVRPLLADRQGWCVFIGTPAGKNEFWRIREEARLNPSRWFYMELKASTSGLLPQEELDDAARIMSEDEYAQEFECSFDAAIKGSYYGKVLNAAADAGRITDVPYDPALPVHVSLDLGYTDSTAVWMWQALGDELRYIRAFERSGLAIADYVDILSHFKYSYGDIWLPHDAKAKSLQTGRSLLEIMRKFHGIRPRLVPELSVQQGIQAARFVITSDATFFDAVNCYDGLEMLRQYQREYDERKASFKEAPKHDKSSHYADSFRYSSLVAHRGSRDFINRVTPRNSDPAYDPTKPFGGNVRLNDLWEQTFNHTY
jgi:phage terminase large subunit